MKRRCEAMASSMRPRRLSKASATRPTSSPGASTVAARQSGSSPRGSMASISAAMRVSGRSVRRTEMKASATAKASPSPLAQATADSRWSTVRSTPVVVAATSSVPLGSPRSTSGTVSARSCPSPGPSTVHHRASVRPADRRSARRHRGRRRRWSRGPRPSAVRTAMTSSSAWACTANHRRASAASWAGSVTRPAGPSRNDVAAESSRRSSVGAEVVADQPHRHAAHHQHGGRHQQRGDGRQPGREADGPPPRLSGRRRHPVPAAGRRRGGRAGLPPALAPPVGRSAVDLAVDLLHSSGAGARGGGRRRVVGPAVGVVVTDGWVVVDGPGAVGAVVAVVTVEAVVGLEPAGAGVRAVVRGVRGGDGERVAGAPPVEPCDRHPEGDGGRGRDRLPGGRRRSARRGRTAARRRGRRRRPSREPASPSARRGSRPEREKR